MKYKKLIPQERDEQEIKDLQQQLVNIGPILSGSFHPRKRTKSEIHIGEKHKPGVVWTTTINGFADSTLVSDIWLQAHTEQILNNIKFNETIKKIKELYILFSRKYYTKELTGAKRMATKGIPRPHTRSGIWDEKHIGKRTVYLIMCVPINKGYVGKADPLTRSYKGSGKELKPLFRKHPIEKFKFSVLEVVPPGVDIRSRERFWIKKMEDRGIKLLNRSKPNHNFDIVEYLKTLKGKSVIDLENMNPTAGKWLIKYGGKTKPLFRWAKYYDIPFPTVYWRLNQGWPLKYVFFKNLPHPTSPDYPKELRRIYEQNKKKAARSTVLNKPSREHIKSKNVDKNCVA